MIQDTTNYPLSELFNNNNQVSYHIPKYQRQYVWNKSNWETLFDDVEESNGGHFLGSIICINTQTDSNKAADFELVDGQQRMTTISLLYLAVYKALLDKLPDPNDAKTILKLELSVRNKIFIEEQNNLRLYPSYSNGNLDDYKWIFSDIIPEIKGVEKPKNLGNRRIRKAFKYFHNRLMEIEGETSKYSYGDIQTILNNLNSATLVKIEVATHADAFTLFETLNNRGVPLSAIDLIKNRLLGELERKNDNGNARSVLDKNFDRWNQILTNLTDDYKTQERFLRQFYNAFKTEPSIEVEKVPKATKSVLIRIYDELISRDVNGVFDRLEEAAKIYGKHIQYDTEENSPELIKALRNLENVYGTDGYMLLLFVSKRFAIDDVEKVKLVNLLCRYFIRRNVTDTPPTRALTNYFMDLIEEATKMESYNYDAMKALLIKFGRPATDAYFEEKLNGNLYEENVGATRYILSSIESHLSETKEVDTDFYKREKNKFIWTVEHIFPQGENIRKDWVDMVGEGDQEKAEQVRKNWVHKLGNLTLTGYNSQLSNMSLEKKQNRKSNDKYIGYKNKLALNEDIKEIPQWKQEDIEKRNKKLVGIALEIFKL